MHAQGKSDNAKANSLTWHTDVKEALVISNKRKQTFITLFYGERLVRMVYLQNEVLKTADFKKMGCRKRSFR
jgi:hypothetical protein